MRQDQLAGERLFVDYAGVTVPVTNPANGEIRQAQIFVATCQTICQFRRYDDTNLYEIGSVERDYYFQSRNDNARFDALSFVAITFDDPEMFSRIQRHVPSFDPAQEVVWGNDVADHEEWEKCLTRAVVLLCRALAYRYTGVISERSTFLRGNQRKEIRAAAVEMLNRADGQSSPSQK